MKDDRGMPQLMNPGRWTCKDSCLLRKLNGTEGLFAEVGSST